MINNIQEYGMFLILKIKVCTSTGQLFNDINILVFKNKILSRVIKIAKNLNLNKFLIKG